MKKAQLEEKKERRRLRRRWWRRGRRQAAALIGERRGMGVWGREPWVERAAPFEGGAEKSLGRTDGADGRRRSPEIGLG
jgi:hypothetical protein